MARPAARRRYSFADYLAIEELSPVVRHEWVGGEIFAMAGGTVEHSALATAFTGLLVAHLRGTPCHAHGSDLRLRLREADVATYADGAVVCDPVERDPSSPTHVTNPRVVIEVLSPSTEGYDREDKRLAYQATPSIQEILLVAQDRRLVEVYRRQASGFARTAAGPGETISLPSIRLELAVDELYGVAGVRVS